MHGRVARAPRSGAASSRRRASSTAPPASTGRPREFDPTQPRGRRQGRRARADAPRPDRGARARAADRADAGAGAAGRPPSRSSTRPRASRCASSSTNASLRDILNFIGERDRHQHHSTTATSRTGQPTRDRARRRHARAGAQPDPDGQRPLLQGAERADDHGHPGQRAEAAQYEEQVIRPSTSRTPTSPSCRSCSTRSCAARAMTGPADDRAEQDGQHDHRARRARRWWRSSSG